MTAYLLDTNILSELARRPAGPAAERARHEEARVLTSVVVAGELRYGCERRGSARLTARMEAVLRAVPVRALDAPADERYGAIRAELEARGTPIGHNDLWIAAHALALGVVLVTDNVGEFGRVPGLPVENWIARG